MQPIVFIMNLSKTYASSSTALKTVNLDIQPQFDSRNKSRLSLLRVS